MELNTVSLNDFVALANIIWVRGFSSVKPAMTASGLVKVMPIDEHTGESRKFSEIDTNEYLSYKGESDQAVRAKVQQGYTKLMTAFRVAENLGISYEMRTRNKYPEVISALVAGGRKGPNTIDLDLSHRLTFMTATSYVDRDGRTVSTTVGDGKALAATDHTLKGSTTTFRNRLANNPQLSKGALEGIGRLITEETYNHLGEKMTATFDILWVTDDPNTKNTAREYLKSKAAPEAAHEGVINVYLDEFRLVVLPRVATTNIGAPDSTKRRYWGVASSENSSFFLGVWEAPHMMPPETNANSEDIENDDWTFRIRAGYGIVIVGAGWIKVSTGDGTA